MIPSLVEAAINDIRDVMLRPHLNAFLDLAYEQVGDPTINIEHIADSRYFISEGIEPLQPPSIFIVADKSEHNLEWANAAIQSHDIFVAALFEDVEIQRLELKGFRYAQALFAVLHDQGTSRIRVLVRSVDYGPTVFSRVSTTARQFRKDVTLRCEVLHAEAF
jgi:hypothetical protein